MRLLTPPSRQREIFWMQHRSPPPKADQPTEREHASRSRRRRTGGSPFFWSPSSFEAARSDVELARARSDKRGAELARTMPHVIAWLSQESELGGLECPSPASDRKGTYRVGLDADGRPEIQRLSSNGKWVTVAI
jgi:hypothetical protein